MLGQGHSTSFAHLADLECNSFDPADRKSEMDTVSIEPTRSARCSWSDNLIQQLLVIRHPVAISSTDNVGYSTPETTTYGGGEGSIRAVQITEEQHCLLQDLITLTGSTLCSDLRDNQRWRTTRSNLRHYWHGSWPEGIEVRSKY